MLGCKIQAKVQDTLQEIDRKLLAASDETKGREFKALRLQFSQEEDGSSDLKAIKQSLIEAMRTAAQPIIEQNKKRIDGNKVLDESYLEELKRYNSTYSPSKPLPPPPTKPEMQPLIQISEVIIEGFETLSPDSRRELLTTLVDTMNGELSEHAAHINHTVHINSQLGSIEKKTQLPHWEIVSPSAPNAVSAIQSTARDLLVRGIEGDQPFRSFVIQWLTKVRVEAGAVFIAEGIRKDEIFGPRMVSSIYTRTLGSLLLQELTNYFDSLPTEALPKNIDRFKIRAISHTDFARDLHVLAQCRSFPFNLTLIKGRYENAPLFEQEPYNEQEFKELLRLIDTAYTKGIRQIDFSGGRFTAEQCEQLIAAIEKCTSQKRPVCRMDNIQADTADLNKLRDAYLKNYRSAHRQRILALLSTERVEPQETKQEEEEKKAIVPPAAPVLRAELEPRPSRIEFKEPARESKRLLKDLHARVSGRKADVQLQVQQQVQQQAQAQQQLQQEAQLETSAQLQALEEKDFIDYPRWTKDYWRYGQSTLNPKQQMLFTQLFPGREKLWFEWTLHGLGLKHNLDGFTKAAMDKLWPYFSSFRDGFDPDALPPGFVVRIMKVKTRDGEEITKRVLSFDPTVRGAGLFSIQLRDLQPQSIEPVEKKTLEALFKSKNDDKKTQEEKKQKAAQIELIYDLLNRNKQNREEKKGHGLRVSSVDEYRLAFYALLWGEQRSVEDIHREFPILAQLDNDWDLRMLTEIALKFDLEAGHQDKTPPKPEILEALLRKLQQIRELDPDHRSFNNLLRYVLRPSDNWNESLMLKDEELQVLHDLAQLSPQDRANWNWLLQRHGESCGYANLQALFHDFQLFNRKYAELTGNADTLDFSKFPPDSVKNMHLFLKYVWIILNNACSFSLEEQIEELREGRVVINQWGPYYASRHQGFGFACAEAGLAPLSDSGREGANLLNESEESMREFAKAEERREEEHAKEQVYVSKALRSPFRPDYAYTSAPVIDYSITRSQLIKDEHRQSSFMRSPYADFYRYLCSRHHRAGLKFSFYRRCAKQVAWIPGTSTGILSKEERNLLVLLAITSTSDRAADFKEAETTEILWERLSKPLIDKELEYRAKGIKFNYQQGEIDFKEYVTETKFAPAAVWKRLSQALREKASGTAVSLLLDWHQSDAFEALSFVEATTLIELFQDELGAVSNLALDQLDATMQTALTKLVEGGTIFQRGDTRKQKLALAYQIGDAWNDEKKEALDAITQKHKDKTGFPERAEAIRALLQDPVYREPFLGVIRETYARRTVEAAREPKPRLALRDCLRYYHQLRLLFDKGKPPSTAPMLGRAIPPHMALPVDLFDEKKEADPETPDPRWPHQLFKFISRIAPLAPPGFNPEQKNEFVPVMQELSALHTLRTAEGYSLAKRLMAMLGEAEVASLNLIELKELFAAAQALGTERLSDKALHHWLKAYNSPRFSELPYVSLPKPEIYSKLAEPYIKRLLDTFPDLRQGEKDKLMPILQALWDPHGTLREVKEEDYAERSAPHQAKAQGFLTALLRKEAIWSKRRTKLIALLTEQPLLGQYGLDFLTELLGTLGSIRAIDADLQDFKVLLDPKATEAEIVKLRTMRETFCPALRRICESQTMTPVQRQRMLALLRDYALKGEEADFTDLSLDGLSQFLFKLAENSTPRRVDDSLSILSKALRQNGSSLRQTLTHLKSLEARLKAPAPTKQATPAPAPIPLAEDTAEDTEAKTEVKDEDDEEEVKDAKARRPAPAPQARAKRQLLFNLLHGLAGEVDAKNCATIMQRCGDEKTVDLPVLEILAATLGRKDSGEDILHFIALLSDLKRQSAPLFNHLHGLCLQLPHLGMKNLLSILSSSEGTVAEKLWGFEQDPHGKLNLDKKGRLPQAKRLNLEDARLKIAAIRDLSRRPDGASVPLFPSQQERLLKMLVAVDRLGNEEKAYLNKAGKRVPAIELTYVELAEYMQFYRTELAQPGLTEAQKQKILLRAIPLMRVAMARATGEYANDAQILDVINSIVRHTDDNCDSQLDPGQGKTLTGALKAACLWLQFGEALVITTDTGLASQNLAHNQDFFRLLGILVADRIITQTAKPGDWCSGGINYGTSIGFELARSGAQLAGHLDAFATQALGVVADEKDGAFFDDPTWGQHTVPLVDTDREGESPLAVYYKAMEADFFNSAEYKALIANPNATETQGFEALKKFLLNLPPPHEATQAQRAALLTLLQEKPDQLETWYIALLHAKAMEKGRDYTVVEREELIEGEWRKVKKVCPYSADGRGVADYDFSDGLQQLLQARMQRKTKDSSYLIKSETEVVLASTNQSFFGRKLGRIIGTTATVGSQREVSQRLRRRPVRVNTSPPEQKPNREDNRSVEHTDAKSHEAAVKARIQQCLTEDPEAPIFVICRDDKRLQEQVLPWINEVKLAESKVEFINGEQSAEEEDERRKKAGQAHTITGLTNIGGRGLDIILEEKLIAKGARVIIVDPPHNKRKEKQYRGRGGRQGQPCKTYMEICKEDLVTKSGKKANNLEELYALNEDWDMQQALLRNYISTVMDAFNPKFLALNAQVLKLKNPEILKQWHRAQITYVAHLRKKWGDLTAEAELEKLWVDNPEAYHAKLAACQEELLSYAITEWQGVLHRYNLSVKDFTNKKAAEAKQAERESQLRKEKAETAQIRARAESAASAPAAGLAPAEEDDEKAGVDRKPTKPLLDPAAELKQIAAQESKAKADNEVLRSQVAQVKSSIDAAALSLEELRAAIPHDQLPYFDLPEQGDEEPEAKSAAEGAEVKSVSPARPLFVNQAKACYDVLVEEGQADTDELTRLKEQAFTEELKNIGQNLGIAGAATPTLPHLLTALVPAIKSNDSQAEREYQRLLAILAWRKHPATVRGFANQLKQAIQDLPEPPRPWHLYHQALSYFGLQGEVKVDPSQKLIALRAREQEVLTSPKDADSQARDLEAIDSDYGECLSAADEKNSQAALPLLLKDLQDALSILKRSLTPVVAPTGAEGAAASPPSSYEAKMAAWSKQTKDRFQQGELEWIDALLAHLGDDSAPFLADPQELNRLLEVLWKLHLNLAVLIPNRRGNQHYLAYRRVQAACARIVELCEFPAFRPLQATQRTLETLIKTGFLDDKIIPQDEKEGAVLAAIQRDYPDLKASGVRIGEAKDFRRTDFMPIQGGSLHASKLILITITFGSPPRTTSIEAYLDPVNKSVYFPPLPQFLTAFDPKHHLPPPQPKAEVKRAIPESKARGPALVKPEGSGKDFKLRFINWYWVLFAIFCAAGGIAFALSGLLAPLLSSLGIELTLAISAKTLISLATWSNPSFWTLIGIGLASGALLLGLVYGTFKLGQFAYHRRKSQLYKELPGELPGELPAPNDQAALSADDLHKEPPSPVPVPRSPSSSTSSHGLSAGPKKSG